MCGQRIPPRQRRQLRRAALPRLRAQAPELLTCEPGRIVLGVNALERPLRHAEECN